MKSSRPIIDENITDRTRKIFLDLKINFQRMSHKEQRKNCFVSYPNSE